MLQIVQKNLIACFEPVYLEFQVREDVQLVHLVCPTTGTEGAKQKQSQEVCSMAPQCVREEGR